MRDTGGRRSLSLRFIAVLVIGLAYTLVAYGEAQPPLDRPAELEDLPEPPDIPPKVQSGETLEPDVRIIRGILRQIKWRIDNPDEELDHPLLNKEVNKEND